MYDMKWRSRVIVDLPPPFGRQDISSTREAADCLIDKWPEPDHSAERDEALRVCLEVYEGHTSPEEASKAFLAAARAGGHPITVQPTVVRDQTTTT